MLREGLGIITKLLQTHIPRSPSPGLVLLQLFFNSETEKQDFERQSKEEVEPTHKLK